MALDKTNVVFPSAQDKLESLMAIELDASGNDLGSNGNIRFVVKWRRKGRQQERATEEPQWITASVSGGTGIRGRKQGFRKYFLIQSSWPSNFHKINLTKFQL